MPGRVSRAPLAPSNSSTGPKKHKNSAKRKRRNLDALSIASKQEPERFKVRQHRLGESEGDAPRRKRQRLEDDDGAADEDGGVETPSGAKTRLQRNSKKGRSEELDVEDGSDSEGNEWRLGGLASDGEDSDIDSDEAFGSGDEERFEDFSFRGSKGGRVVNGHRRPRSNGGDPDLMDLGEGPEEEEDDSFGDEGVDLVDMLDQSQEDDASDMSEDKQATRDHTRATARSDSSKKSVQDASKIIDEDAFHTFGSDSGGLSDADEPADEGSPNDENSEEDEDDYDSATSISDAESDENDPQKLHHLQEFVSALPKANETSNGPALSQAQRMLQALQNMSDLDPSLSRSARKLVESAGLSTDSKAGDLVKVPLPKRQQNKLDRTAAYKTAKDTLGRWIDTVKHNRRAEHLSFPLKDPEAREAQGTSQFLPNDAEAPRTELERTIQDILQESGLASKTGKSEEERIRQQEELETNKLPMEEVLARRAELRRTRDLLFRDEVRARRIKKIKSKAYRRVHRKERERDMQKERALLTEAGVDLSDEEREANDRRRAEERMGARHRESRWAKSMKKTGRTVWDEDARSGVMDMLQRDEQLRKRVDGENATNENDDASDDSDEASGIEPLDLKKQLEDIQNESEAEPFDRLTAMPFMKKARAAQKLENDAAIEDILKSQREEDGGEESEPEPTGQIGRRVFGPTKIPQKELDAPKEARNEFEEHSDSNSGTDDDEENEVLKTSTLSSDANPAADSASATAQKQRQTDSGRPKLSLHGRAQRYEDLPRGIANRNKDAHDLPPSASVRVEDQPVIAAGDAPANLNGWTTVNYSQDDKEDSDEDQANDTFAMVPRNEDLVRAAFGGDEVEADFEKEKKALVEDEDDKVIDNALPGWGSWVGDGIGKRELNRNRGKFMSKEEGVKATNRKDAKLDRAIISEKRVKKNAKYLASTLPHPFESRQQYERALRIPIGPEWTTKETFQGATKPRVMVKQGIIKPMERPMV